MVLHDILTSQWWKKTACQTTLAALQHGKTSKKRAAFFFIGTHELDNNTFSAQFPLNAVISHLRKTFQSPLSTVLLTDLLPGCQVLTSSWRALLSLSLCVYVCSCAYVQHCPATWNGTSQIPRSPPKGPLHGQRPPRLCSPRSVPGQLRRTLRSRWVAVQIILFTLMPSDVHQTLWIRGFLLKVIPSSITRPSLWA